jgi:TolB-like protein
MLRPDPAIDFLAFGLADAVSSALSGLSSLVVRSTVTASGLVRDAPDISAIAKALDVDLVLLGTLLSSGDQVRVSAQLVQAPSGTLVRTTTSQAAMGEIFQLQDALAKSVVESLSQSLTPRDHDRVNRDAPANAEAYECYLRANGMQLQSRQWATARDLYLRCVDLDPGFAPAWARLGRCSRLLGKFDDPSNAKANFAFGEHALRRALDINPDLSLAHHLYAQVEVEAGRAREAMARLLGRVRSSGSDAQLFAGLVHACRYCGLFDASEAAYERARRLDATVITSVAQTFMQKRDWGRVLETDMMDPPFAKAMALLQLGRREEAVALLRTALDRGLPAQLHQMMSTMMAYAEGNLDEVVRRIHSLMATDFPDPEGFYHWGCALAQAGDHEAALELLERCVNAGCAPLSALMREPRLDPLRSASDFRQIVQRARELHDKALETFRAGDGPRLLGMASAEAMAIDPP